VFDDLTEEQARICSSFCSPSFRSSCHFLKAEKIKKIDAILWEIKYFKLISDEKKEDERISVNGPAKVGISIRVKPFEPDRPPDGIVSDSGNILHIC
jgi:hypothetical protein